MIHPITDKDILRFWSKVDIQGPDECWNWLTGRFDDDYGHFSYSIGPRKHHSVRAHRLAYQIEHGSIPDGLLVLHTCIANRGCCNPAHLYVGTHQDNMNDRTAQGRNPAGERSGKAILNWGVVELIRSMKTSGYKIREIATVLDIARGTVQNVVTNRTWKTGAK